VDVLERVGRLRGRLVTRTNRLVRGGDLIGFNEGAIEGFARRLITARRRAIAN